jgi:hypothetical protein
MQNGRKWLSHAKMLIDRGSQAAVAQLAAAQWDTGT